MNGALLAKCSGSRMPPVVKRVARIGAAALLTALVLSLVDVQKVWLHLERFDPAAGVAMLIVNVLVVVLFAARWRAVAAALGVRAPYTQFLRGTWLGALFSQLGPSVVLNEITRFKWLSSYGDTWQVAASQLFDRVSGNVVLASVIVLLLPYYLRLFGADTTYRILLTIGGIVGLGALVVALTRMWRSARQKLGSTHGIWNPLEYPGHYAYSLGIQLLLMTNLWLAAYGLGAAGSGLEVYLVAPLVLGILTLLPISIADWGSREAAALLFLSVTPLTAEQIVAISVLYGLASLASTLPGALLLLERGKS